MRDVYPSLRTYCQQRGLEFQVVDMRWGVRDEAAADHKTNELCVQEIKNCQRLTPGPNFVVGKLWQTIRIPFRLRFTIQKNYDVNRNFSGYSAFWETSMVIVHFLTRSRQLSLRSLFKCLAKGTINPKPLSPS